MSLPLQIATVSFLRKGEKTLFLDYRVKQTHPIHAGKLSPPGGKLESTDTSPIERAIKEIFEETNIIARSLIYRGKVTFLNEKRTINGKPMSKNWEVNLYDCYDFDDNNAVAREGEIYWVDNNEVSKLPLHEGDYVLWKWLSQFKKFEGEIEHIGNKLTRAELKSSTPFK